MLFFNTELPTEQCTHSALVLFWVFDSTYLLCEDYYFLLLNCSVFNMTPPTEVIGFCLKKTWKYDCAMCPSVFSTWGHNQLHNLKHFNRCTMCKLTLWSRDRLGKTKCQLQNPKPTCPYHPQVCLQQSQHPGHPHTSHLSQVPTVHYVWSNHITKGFAILQCSSSGLISVDSGIAAMPLLSSVRLSQRISCSGFLLTNKNLQFWKPVYNRTFPLKAGYSLKQFKIGKQIFF